MRAAVFTRPGLVELTDLPTPSAGPGEILLKVEAATLCGTDLRIRSGAKSAGVVPGTVKGHELAGRIEQVGDGVDRVGLGREETALALRGHGPGPGAGRAVGGDRPAGFGGGDGGEKMARNVFGFFGHGDRPIAERARRFALFARIRTGCTGGERAGA